MLTAYIGGLMGSGIPKDISKRIDSEQDYARLRGWARAIGRASSFDELRTLLDA